ncbi:hypothetical protein J6590_064282 [Homalodisca vitripennis]|nr:hypothetical protein J6590_064282 [Homalodisca vitripennis]
MDQFHTLSIQQKSMDCRGLYIHFSQLVQEIQNVSIDEDLKMDWNRIDEIHDDSSLLVKGIQNVSIAEDLKMDWKKIDEIHDDSSQLVQDIQNVSIDEDLKMDWKRIDEIHVDSSLLVQGIQYVSIAEDLKMDRKRIDEIHDDSSLLVQGIQNVSIAEDHKMDWKRIDEMHNDSSPLVQKIQDLCIADDLKKESTENNKLRSKSFTSNVAIRMSPPVPIETIRAGLGCVLCALGVEELAAIPCVSSESDSGQSLKIPHTRELKVTIFSTRAVVPRLIHGLAPPVRVPLRDGSCLCLSFHIHVRHGPYSEHILTYRIKLPPIYRDMAESTDDKLPRRYALTLHIIFLRLRGTEQGKVLCRVKRTVTWKCFDSHNVFDERNETRV